MMSHTVFHPHKQGICCQKYTRQLSASAQMGLRPTPNIHARGPRHPSEVLRRETWAGTNIYRAPRRDVSGLS